MSEPSTIRGASRNFGRNKPSDRQRDISLSTLPQRQGSGRNVSSSRFSTANSNYKPDHAGHSSRRNSIRGGMGAFALQQQLGNHDTLGTHLMVDKENQRNSNIYRNSVVMKRRTDLLATIPVDKLVPMAAPETQIPKDNPMDSLYKWRREGVTYNESELYAILKSEPWEVEAHRESQRLQRKPVLILASDPTAVYRNFSIVGQGTSGIVYRANSIQDSRTTVAIKCFKPKDRAEQDMFLREVQIMQYIPKHQNILQSVMAYTHEQQIWNVMEYVPGQSLYHHIQKNVLTDTQIIRILYQLVSAVHHIHQHNILHRDIKSDNILFHPDSGVVKLADFGFATKLEHPTDTRTAILGSAYWMSPEVIRGDEYSFPADIWSIGMVCMECILGVPVYYGQLEPVVAMRMIAECGMQYADMKGLQSRSRGLQDFVGCCLEMDASKRHTARMLLSHDVFADNKEVCHGAVSQTVVPVVAVEAVHTVGNDMSMWECSSSSSDDEEEGEDGGGNDDGSEC